MKPFAVGLIGAALAGLLLRDANGTVTAYFVIGIAAGWVGRGWIGPAWLVGGTVTAWLALGLLEALGIAGTMWGTATAPRGEEATLWLLSAVMFVVILIIEVLGYGVGIATIRLARRWGRPEGGPTRARLASGSAPWPSSRTGGGWPLRPSASSDNGDDDHAEQQPTNRVDDRIPHQNVDP